MLTPRQKQILEYIKKYIGQKGYSPSLDEIKRHFRLSSKSTVHQHLQTLEEKGYIRRNAGHVRALDVFDPEQMIQVPLVGTIAAGEPIEAIEDKESIAVSRSRVPKNGDIYALRVKGNSMIDEGINDGDIVLVKQQAVAENGQKVVALIDNNEATLKKFYKERRQIRLQPANKEMEPIIIKNGRDVSIQGVVVDIVQTSQRNSSVAQKHTNTFVQGSIKNGLDSFRNRIIEGDCLDVMPQIPDKSIDMILCDLPYGMTQNTWDKSLIPLDKLWKEYTRIIKDEGVIVLTSQGIFTANLIASNPKFFRYKLVWVKSKATNFLNAKKQPLRKHEDICIFYKNQPKYSPQMETGIAYNKGFRKNQLTGSYGDFNSVEVKSDGERYPSDVIYFKTAESEGEVFHPTQKPVELGQYLIRTYTTPGDLVLDNACGSGSFLVAAVLENREFIGVEKNEEMYLHKNKRVDYIQVCNQRIEEAYKRKKQEELFPRDRGLYKPV